MRNLSIFGIVLPAIVLLIHILFNLQNYIPVLMANFSIAISSLTLLLAILYLHDHRKNPTTKKVDVIDE